MKKHNLIFLSVIFLIVIITNINAIADSVGKYYVKPSFKVDINYNFFNDYKVLIEKVKILLTECPNEESCINDKIDIFNAEHNNLVLSLGSCDKGAKKIFYDFIENYESCVNSKDKDCICEFSLNFNDYNLKGESKIRLLKDKKIELEKPEGTGLTYYLNNIPSYAADNPSQNYDTRNSISYKIKYEDDGSFKEAKLVQEINNRNDPEWDYNKVKLYKKNDNTVIFVKNGGIKRACARTKNIFKFCAVNTKKQFYVYDPVIDKVVSQNPTIKFALYMEDLPPPPIENLKIYDKKKADQSVILRWNKSKAADVDSHHIYYSKDNFVNNKIENYKIKDTNKKVVKVKDAIKFKTVDLDSVFCEFDNNICVFKYDIVKEDGTQEKIELKNKELYLINEEKYIYVLDLENYEEYNFAVTAVDIAGNEIDNVNEKWKLSQGKNYAQGKAEDDLAPGIVELNEPEIKTKDSTKVIELSWSKPLKNIDGTPIKDKIDYYNVYYKEGDFDLIDDSLNVKPEIKDVTLDIDLNEFDEGKTYHFAVTAVDIAGNGFKERVITKEKKIIK